MALSFLKQLSATRDAAAEGHQQIGAIREEIALTKAEVAKIKSAPQPIAEAMAHFDRWAEQQADEAVARLRPAKLLEPSISPQGLSLPHVVSRIAGEPVANTNSVDDCLFGLLLATSLPALRSIIEAQLTGLAEGRAGLESAL